MKTTQRMSRWFGALAALLLLSAVSFTLTSCGDDDDDYTVMFDGEKLTVTSVELYDWGTATNDDGTVQLYGVYLYGTDAEGNKGRMGFQFHDGILGQTKSLTDDLTWYGTGGSNNGWVGFWIEPYNEGHYGEGDSYWTDEEGFKSGTIYLNVSGGTVTIKAQGVTKYDEPFNFNYSGKYKKVEESLKVKGKK